MRKSVEDHMELLERWLPDKKVSEELKERVRKEHRAFWTYVQVCRDELGMDYGGALIHAAANRQADDDWQIQLERLKASLND